MQAEFVRPEQLGDRRMVGERSLERGQIAFEIHAFFKIADESRREADELYAIAQAVVGDDVMFGKGRRLRVSSTLSSISYARPSLRMVASTCRANSIA